MRRRIQASGNEAGIMVGAEELEGSIAPCGSKGLIHSGTDGNHLGVLGGSPSFSLRERSGPWRPGAGRVRCRRACCASEWACYGIVVRCWCKSTRARAQYSGPRGECLRGGSAHSSGDATRLRGRSSNVDSARILARKEGQSQRKTRTYARMCGGPKEAASHTRTHFAHVGQ